MTEINKIRAKSFMMKVTEDLIKKNIFTKQDATKKINDLKTEIIEIMNDHDITIDDVLSSESTTTLESKMFKKYCI